MNPIHNILTLRYHPTHQSKTHADFETNWSDPDGYRVQKLIERSIIQKLSDYDHIGLSLSSGVDSQLLLALIRRIWPKKKITCFSMSFHGAQSEIPLAASTALKYGCNFQTIPDISIIKNIDKLSDVTDEPRWNTYNVIPTEKAKEAGCDCLVSGDGADEIFAGYVFRYKQMLSGQSYFEAHRNDWIPEQEKLIRNFSWVDLTCYFDDVIGFEKKKLDDLTNILRLDFNGKLTHDFIPTTKAIEKKVGLPIIAPYLDKDVVEWCLHLPSYEKFDGEVGKLHLRKTAKRLGLELHQKKIGFSPNLVKEFEDFTLHYQADKVKQYVNEIDFDLKDTRYCNKLLQLYCLEKKLQ